MSRYQPKKIVTGPLLIARYFSVCVLGLVLLGSPVSQVHAEQAKANPHSAIVTVTVNVNTASVSDLAEALIGIGMKKAEAIVQYREQHGPFTDKQQLLNIKGIGEATLRKNNSVIMLK